MKRAVILSGSGGSHPATIAAVANALSRVDPGRPVVVLNLSAFDTRGRTDYSSVPAETISLIPQELGLPTFFRTAAPNLLLAGGSRRFKVMADHFADLLAARGAGAVLLCHNHGFPEQAVIRAAARGGIALAQIDEGPFSGMVTGPLGRSSTGKLERLLVRLGLMPLRDQSGATHDLFFPTSPARARTLVSRGIPLEKIVTVAAPRFDSLPRIATRWRARKSAPERRTRILILHQPFGRDAKVDAAAAAKAERVMIDGLVRAAAGMPLSVTLRAHPRSDAAEIERLERLLAPFDHAFVSTREPLYHQFEYHDAALGFYSSALLEAAAIGMPCASVLIPRKAFARAGEAAKAQAIPGLGIATAEEAGALAVMISKMIQRGPVGPPAALFDEALGELNGDSAERVARTLVLLADGWRP